MDRKTKNAMSLHPVRSARIQVVIASVLGGWSMAPERFFVLQGTVCSPLQNESASK
jgi:hypothetical protein